MMRDPLSISSQPGLRALVRSRLSRPVPPQLARLGALARGRHGGERGTRAVLAYGSTLRDADFSETLADLYVLTADFRAVSGGALARLGCRLLPPNVHYLQLDEEGGGVLRAKYAVLPLNQFARWCGRDVRNPYFWARFAQPSRLVWAADETAREEVFSVVEEAVRTALWWAGRLHARRSGGAPANWRGLWTELLRATYASELRVERGGRAAAIVEADEEWFRATTRAVLGREEDIGELPGAAAPPRWGLTVAQGRALSMLRLAKAAFTFSGGADYIAFKIERHTGERITLTPFQRRHPLLAGLAHLPRLLRRGIVK